MFEFIKEEKFNDILDELEVEISSKTKAQWIKIFKSRLQQRKMGFSRLDEVGLNKIQDFILKNSK